MSRNYRIAVYKAERDAGLAESIQANASVAYCVPVSPVEDPESPLCGRLLSAFAAERADAHTFDLYYLRDVLVTTGWNKNHDIFDNAETWAARHTPEDKPFNFEHRPLDIIGHITESRVVDEDMNDVDDSLAVDELPPKFHIVNGSVLYMALSDDGRKKLMEQTVAEIKRGEWYVSMECLFCGFDYGVVRPDGSHGVIRRSEATAFLTKHLQQYGGGGTYVDEQSGTEFTLGRLLRNITFSGKGLVRKPANPESVILNGVAAFRPTREGLGSSHAEPPAISTTTESNPMPDANAADQALRDQNAKLERQVEGLQREIADLKSKGTETTIAKLQQDVAERDKTIASLHTQLEAVKESSQALQARAEKAEADLKQAQGDLAAVKAAETLRSRLAVLREKGADDAVAAKLVDKLAGLDDAAFAETVDTISASWKKAEPPRPKPKVDPVVAAVTHATPEPEPALATAGHDGREQALAAVVDFLGKSLREARAGRPSVYQPLVVEE